MDIQGLAAIVTGGASGLGGATAQMLASKGAKVAIFDLNEEAGQAHAQAIGGSFFRLNVADDQSVTDAVAAAEAAPDSSIMCQEAVKRLSAASTR